jgi:hypothetical protein
MTKKFPIIYFDPLKSGQLVPKAKIAWTSLITGGEEAKKAKSILNYADHNIVKA